ncbi:ubiquinone biosynthesis protein UbiA [Runella sp. CRIBMP]|uniref:UbiA family prenyltransferase n=1 Tax=Runella sp. CRIBMP TaxID=2683261 RepID=UPI001411D945|nr:UbiA family prenyltransferase [Runella sp. CRIBMP]NBB19472.1 ubiquinone biosynthesis protein UbiA [Runella sp. CRIBMP]
MKNILLHLRIPFSFFLLPIFLFALSQSPHPDTAKGWWVFFILHFLLFPASNAYNSYYDKDEGSIGLLETPPPVTKELYYVAWVCDILALVLGWLFVGELFTGYLLIYGLISKAYSHPLVRLKKYPILSWVIVTIFQGALTYLAVFQSINNLQTFASLIPQLLPALVCTSNLLAIYPLTQVYQHEEDAKRGDMTMSRLLGIKGTFLNACFWLLLSGGGYLGYFGFTLPLLLLVILLFPLLAFFGWWTWKTWDDEHNANFRNTMRLNLLASVCLNIFFGILCFL